MLQPDSLTYYFSLTHELPDVEFKGPGKGRDNPLFGRVVRAAIAMTNRRGGGTIIIGISEQAAGLSFDGLSNEQLATWKPEDIASGFNSYTSSPIDFDRRVYDHEGKKFLVLNIHEFAVVPVMCVKEYRDKSNPKMPDKECPIILRASVFYVRTLNKSESKEMLMSEEVRLLIGLANDKAVQTFVALTKLAGINIAPQPNDQELFAQQLKDWTGPTLEEIRSRGYWDIHIRPATFEQARLPLSELRQLLIRASIDYLGWEFPYITPRMPEWGLDWIGLEYQKELRLQAWRFFQSGLFAAEVGFLEDWHDKWTHPLQGSPKPDEILSTLDVVFRLTEIFGLAARLAISDVYRNERSVVVELNLCKVDNRRLYGQGTYGAVPFQGYKDKNISYTVTLAKEDIIGRPKELALEAAQYIFERFGWNPSTQLLATIQSELNIHN